MLIVKSFSKPSKDLHMSCLYTDIFVDVLDTEDLSVKRYELYYLYKNKIDVFGLDIDGTCYPCGDIVEDVEYWSIDRAYSLDELSLDDSIFLVYDGKIYIRVEGSEKYYIEDNLLSQMTGKDLNLLVNTYNINLLVLDDKPFNKLVNTVENLISNKAKFKLMFGFTPSGLFKCDITDSFMDNNGEFVILLALEGVFGEESGYNALCDVLSSKLDFDIYSYTSTNNNLVLVAYLDDFYDNFLEGV